MPTSAIPPVSMSAYDSDFDGFARELGGWFERTGFAVVGDHGMDQGVLDTAMEATRAFFALPRETKQRYLVPGGGGQRGYTAFGVETAKDHAVADLKEFWHTGRNLPPGHRYEPYMPPNLSVPDVPGFDAAMAAFFGQLDQLGVRIRRTIARHLDLEPDWFTPKVTEGNSVLRLLHYPPVTGDIAPGAIRAGAHGDINVITVLLGSEEPGLQLLDREGQWRDVIAPKGHVAINIGDMLSRLTNDRLPSTIHRVVNPQPERMRHARYSTPFFLHFAPDVLVETLPLGGPPRHAPITAHDFLQQRLREIKLA
jgi:isopenicillin N synthase-like dioxygenase